MRTTEDLYERLRSITIAGSLGWGWAWHAVAVRNDGDDRAGFEEPVGFLLSASFNRPDINTGLMGRGTTRKAFVSRLADANEVARTAYTIYRLTVEHEAAECFHWNGCRVYDPHHTVAELGTLRGRVLA